MCDQNEFHEFHEYPEEGQDFGFDPKSCVDKVEFIRNGQDVPQTPDPGTLYFYAFNE